MSQAFACISLSHQPQHANYNSGVETLSRMVRDVNPRAEIEFEHEQGHEESSGAYLFDNTVLMTEFGLRYLPSGERVAQMVEGVRREDALS